MNASKGRTRRARLLRSTAVLLFAVSFGCDPSPFPSWPPRTGANDGMAEVSGVSVEVVHVISSKEALRMDGRRDLGGAQFLPVAGEFRVLGGELTSALGPVHRKARFGTWTLFYANESRQEIVGWGPCLTDGEVIVPNLFLAEATPGRWVPNSFEAQDLGEYHTLVRLEEDRGDKLCLGYRPADGSSYRGNLKATGSLNLSGQVDTRPTSSDRLLFGTAGGVGTRARVGEHLLVRRADGWYLGERRVGPPE